MRDTPPEIAEQVEIQVKYAGYINRQEEQVARLRKLESLRLPADINYNEIPGLSTEVKEKLNRVKPISMGQAFEYRALRRPRFQY